MNREYQFQNMNTYYGMCDNYKIVIKFEAFLKDFL